MGRCECLLFSTATVAVVGGILVGCIQMWLKEKSYVFTAEEVAAITRLALNSSTDTSENTS